MTNRYIAIVLSWLFLHGPVEAGDDTCALSDDYPITSPFSNGQRRYWSFDDEESGKELVTQPLRRDGGAVFVCAGCGVTLAACALSWALIHFFAESV